MKVDIEHKTRLAVVFPGQGSQNIGMLDELAAAYPVVQETFAEASAAVGFDLWEITHDESRLNNTEFTQPVLLTASVAIWRVLRPILEQYSSLPYCLAGHSLGEYSALVASGVLNLTDAVKLVHRRGQLMTLAVAGVDTQMAAVLGLDDERVISLCDSATDSVGKVNAANFNSPGQVVIAGTAQGVAHVLDAVETLGKKAVPLKVSVPSHCLLMLPAQDELAKLLHGTLLHQADIPVIQNRHAQVHKSLADIKTALAEQLSMPVQWTKTMQALSDKHIELIIECGPGNVLSNLAKRQATPIVALPTDKVTRLEKIFEVLAVKTS